MAGDKAGALADISTQTLVDRVENGEIPSRIAEQLGVTKAAVYYHLHQHPDYQPARKTGMAIRLDEAESNIIAATDTLSLGRATQAFRAVAWRAEREHPAEWGAMSKLAGADGGPLQVQIVKFAGTTIDGAAQQMTDVTPVLPQVIDK